MTTHSRSWSAITVLSFAALALFVLISTHVRAAGPWYVAPGGDDINDCLSAGSPCATINGALAKVGFTAGDTIFVATGTYTSSTSEVVMINKSVTLSGGWDVAFTTQNGMSTIDGEGARMGIKVGDSVPSGVTAIIENFIVQNGLYNGISNIGILTLNHSTIHGNNSVGAGGGGGIFNAGELTINDSIISGNTSREGGGILQWSGFGSAILILNNTTVSGNTATVVGPADPGSGGGIKISNGILTLNNSTVSGNTAGNGGGGIAVNYNSGTVTLENSTISGNTSQGIFHGGGGGISNGGILTLNNSTISGNTASNGGGGISGTATLQNSILAGNTATGTGPDCSGTISSAGYNLIGNTTNCTITGDTTGNMTGMDTMLGPLQDNGGPTLTHAFLPSSPAINAGNPAGCMGSLGLLTTDQRGLTRFGRCDIGAYEEQAIKSVNDSLILPGDPMTYTISFHNGGTSPYASARITDTLPISVTYTSNSLTATSGSYGYDSGVITWIGSVNAGNTVTITFGATLGQSVTPGTVITNSAVINGAGEMITRTATIQVDFHHVYLPLITTPPPPPAGIYGQVKFNGAPAAGELLYLLFFDGSSREDIATTTTDASGRYSFTDVPSLTPGQGQYYRVIYQNNLNNGRLGLWNTRKLWEYTTGSAVAIGDFDIADIALVSPADGATVSLPYIFQWTPRPATPSDSYDFELYDDSDFEPYFSTEKPLGYVGSYNRNSLPEGFNVGELYVWEICVLSPDDGIGCSNETREVYFSNSGFSATNAAQPKRPKTASNLENRLGR